MFSRSNNFSFEMRWNKGLLMAFIRWSVDTLVPHSQCSLRESELLVRNVPVKYGKRFSSSVAAFIARHSRYTETFTLRWKLVTFLVPVKISTTFQCRFFLALDF